MACPFFSDGGRAWGRPTCHRATYIGARSVLKNAWVDSLPQQTSQVFYTFTFSLSLLTFSATSLTEAVRSSFLRLQRPFFISIFHIQTVTGVDRIGLRNKHIATCPCTVHEVSFAANLKCLSHLAPRKLYVGFWEPGFFLRKIVKTSR